MYVFYDNTGKIIGGCAAESQEVVLTRIPDGTSALYLDDREHEHVWSNLGRYQIQNNKPVPRVFTAEEVEEAKQGKITALDAACQATILSGFVSQGTGTPQRYAFDMEGQTNLMSELEMINADPFISSVKWKTLSSGLLTHTRAQFMQVCRDGRAWKKNNIEKYHQLKAQVLAATTMEQVEAIQWEVPQTSEIEIASSASSGNNQLVEQAIVTSNTKTETTIVTKTDSKTKAKTDAQEIKRSPRQWFSNLFAKRNR